MELKLKLAVAAAVTVLAGYAAIGAFAAPGITPWPDGEASMTKVDEEVIADEPKDEPSVDEPKLVEDEKNPPASEPNKPEPDGDVDKPDAPDVGEPKPPTGDDKPPFQCPVDNEELCRKIRTFCTPGQVPATGGAQADTDEET